MRGILPLLYFMILSFSIPQAYAADVYLTPDQYSGSSSTTSGGVTGKDTYSSFQIQWSITAPSQNGTQYYHYVYTLTDSSGNALKHPQNNFLLEVSTAITSSNGTISNISPGLVESGPRTYTTANFSTLPGSIYAIDLSTPSNPAGMYSFDSTKAPVWGDFYAQSNRNRRAYNTSFGVNPTGSSFSTL